MRSLKELQKELNGVIKRFNANFKEMLQNIYLVNSSLAEMETIVAKINHFSEVDRKELDLYKEKKDKIDKDYNNIMVNLNDSGINIKETIAKLDIGIGAVTTVAGQSIVMGVVATFGTASTGTAISTLSGAAATNAIMAWLGGGSLAVGGGGVALGSIVFSIIPFIGLTITFLGLRFYFFIKDHSNIKKRMCIRDIKKYKSANGEIRKRIVDLKKHNDILNKYVKGIKPNVLGYETLCIEENISDAIKYMNECLTLINEPIIQLMGGISKSDIDEYAKLNSVDYLNDENNKIAVFLYTNSIYNIKATYDDKIELIKLLKKHHKKTLNKVYFNDDTIEYGDKILDYKNNRLK